MGAGPEKSSSRAEGWIWGAINPMLESLHAENRFLANRNLTFRGRTRTPAWIHHALEYLDPNGWILFEDLEYDHPDVQRELAPHDLAYDDAVESATRFFSELLVDPAFADTVQHAIALYIEDHGGKTHDVFPLDNAVEVVAERIVNHVERLNESQPDAAFWDTQRSLFERFLREGKSADQLWQDLDTFKTASDQLLAFLKDKRRALSREHGVAPAPYRRA